MKITFEVGEPNGEVIIDESRLLNGKVYKMEGHIIFDLQDEVIVDEQIIGVTNRYDEVKEKELARLTETKELFKQVVKEEVIEEIEVKA